MRPFKCLIGLHDVIEGKYPGNHTCSKCSWIYPAPEYKVARCNGCGEETELMRPRNNPYWRCGACWTY